MIWHFFLKPWVMPIWYWWSDRRDAKRFIRERNRFQ